MFNINGKGILVNIEISNNADFPIIFTPEDDGNVMDLTTFTAICEFKMLNTTKTVLTLNTENDGITLDQYGNINLKPSISQLGLLHVGSYNYDILIKDVNDNTTRLIYGKIKLENGVSDVNNS